MKHPVYIIKSLLIRTFLPFFKRTVRFLEKVLPSWTRRRRWNSTLRVFLSNRWCRIRLSWSRTNFTLFRLFSLRKSCIGQKFSASTSTRKNRVPEEFARIANEFGVILARQGYSSFELILGAVVKFCLEKSRAYLRRYIIPLTLQPQLHRGTVLISMLVLRLIIYSMISSRASWIIDHWPGCLIGLIN